MVSLNASKKSRGGKGNYQPPENVYVQVMAVNDTPGAKEPNPKDDTIDAGLLADAFGLKADFDADGNPTTIVKARIAQDEATKKRRYSNPDPTKKPTEMWDLKTGRKKGTGDRMGKSPVVILEKAKLNAAGEIEAQFIFIAQRDRDSEKELVIENVLSTVGDEGSYSDGGKFQKRKIYLDTESVKVTSLDELKAAVQNKLSDDRAEKPFALIRVVEDKVHETEVEVFKTDDEGNEVLDADGQPIVVGKKPRYPYEARAASVYLGREGDVTMSPEASIEAWLTNPPRDADAEMADIIQAFLVDKSDGHEGLIFEVIGGFTYNTGKQSLPSANGRRSDHYSFQMPWENPETGVGGIDRKTGKPYVTQGVSRAHMVLGRVEDQETPGTYGSWYAQKTFTTKAYGQDLFQEREIITQWTPPAVAALFQAQAERREKARAEQFFEQNNSRGAAPKEDDDIPHEDNQPAYDGGMAMNR